jgi:hypothetical protein
MPTQAAQSDLAEIGKRIVVVRGQRVLLDTDLARPRNLRSQFATSSWGGRRYRILAFTEHGAFMAANVLNSQRATEMSIYVVRAFVRLRELLASNRVYRRSGPGPVICIGQR